MVNPEHLEVARRAFAAFTSRDPEAMVAVCDPEIEFMSLINEADGRVYCGHAGIREFFADQDEAFSSFVATLDEFESHGDQALTCGRITAEARTSGMTLDISFAQLARLSPDGLILGWRFYRSREEALAALESGDLLGLGRPSAARSSPE